MAMKMMGCERCGRVVSRLTLGLCDSCIEHEMANSAIAGGQGRTGKDVADSAEVIAWGLLVLVVTVGACVAIYALNGGA